MVGRFIEQQQIGAAHERPRHVDAHPPAAGKTANRPLVFGVIKPQSVHQLGSARARIVPSYLRIARVPGTQALAIVVLGGRGNLRLDGAELSVAVEHELDGRLVRGVDILRDMSHHQIARHVETADIRVHSATHQFQQGRFAAAVFAGDANFLAAKQAESGTRK